MSKKEADLTIETSADSVLEFKDLARQKDNAIDVIFKYGMIDGSHHKQWVLDQVLRALLEDEYEAIIKELNSDEEYEPWDEGIPP